MAILDHSLPLQVKAPDMMGMLDQGSQLAQFYTQQKSDGELNRLYKEANGDLNKMLEIGKTSPLARFVMPQLQAQQAAQQKAVLDQQKIEADIGKVKSEAFKNNQQGGGYGLDNSGKLIASANQALTVAAQTGDPMAARLALSNHLKAGSITPELYAQFDEQIRLIGNNPDELKKYAQSIVLAQSKDPDKYMFETADNVLDNETTRRGQDIDQTVAGDRLAFDYEKTDAENQYKYDALEQNENQFWADFNQKDAQFYSDQDFQLMKSKLEKQQVKNETPEQRMTRIDNTVGSADAARSAARAAQDAAALIDHPGIRWGTGATSFLGLVPGKDEKDFRVRLENLKSQVFLPTVKALQGMGALSNAEGEKIAAAVANLDPGLDEAAMKQQLTILAQQMSRAAQVSKQKALNYATRGGTIQLQTNQGSRNQGSGKIYTQAMIREYAQQTGRSAQEIAQAVRDSGGTIQ